MLEVSSLRLCSPPTPPSPSSSSKAVAAAAATDPAPHQLIGFVGGDHVHAAGFPTSGPDDGFMDDDTDSLLLDYIDFSSCDVVVPFFDADGDVLPDLEADPTELLAEFSSSCAQGQLAHHQDYGGDDDPAAATVSPGPAAVAADDGCCRAVCLIIGDDNDEAKPPPPPPLDHPDVGNNEQQDLRQPTMEEVVVVVHEDKKAADEEKRWLLGVAAAAAAAADHNKKDKEGDEEEPAGGGSTYTTSNLQEEDSAAGAGADAKSSSSSASAAEGQQRYHQTHHGKKKPPPASNASKRKVKVDWTPDLHRRFVQAVEQLGIDKAVPSRILEIMGIQGLTRHNIASHLQKYRSHRKHLMAREAEAASWAQKRQMYAAAAAAGGGATPAPTLMMNSKQSSAAAAAGPRPWVVPTIGFPPPPAPFCRPLHVWGHPPAVNGTAAVEAAAPAPAPAMLLPLPAVWPRRPTWPVDPAAYWHQQYSAARKWGPPQPAAVTQGTPCMPAVPVPPPMPMQLPRFPVPPHPVPTTMYSRPPMAAPPPPAPAPAPPSSKLAELQLQLDAHPSKESIDAAIGDVLVKPWLPLPLGLKPPSLDSVMSELHRHGIPKVPPAAAAREP
ncbi:hypothetical protein U9M48_021351 [Paspalum notatum var. saurae]|uniref:HTH myb-type domain-containing protein n=1 Tax=Paspalum notatum var. saurae TaxID=547442 RepID=A0AAQ3TFF4_PASNO